MMNIKNNKLIAFFMLINMLLIYSCTKPLDINVPQAPSKISVFSQIIPNQVVMVGVTKSFSSLTQITDTTQGQDTSTVPGLGILLGRAFVTIKHQNTIDTLEKIFDGVYGSTKTFFKPLEWYDLYVYDSVSGEHITATTQVMSTVEDSIFPIVEKTPTDTIVRIKYKIKDDPSTEDFYYLDFSGSGKSDFLNQASNYYKNVSSATALILHSDKEAKNGFIEGEYNNDNLNLSIGPTDSVTVVVAHVSRTYYQFLTAYKKSNSLFNQLVGEPITYPSNVVGGYGLFTAHFPDIHFLDMKDY